MPLACLESALNVTMFTPWLLFSSSTSMSSEMQPVWGTARYPMLKAVRRSTSGTPDVSPGRLEVELANVMKNSVLISDRMHGVGPKVTTGVGKDTVGAATGRFPADTAKAFVSDTAVAIKSSLDSTELNSGTNQDRSCGCPKSISPSGFVMVQPEADSSRVTTKINSSVALTTEIVSAEHPSFDTAS